MKRLAGRSRVFVYLALCTVLLSCGVQKPPGRGENPAKGPRTLVLFGAGFCTTCKSDFPEIQTLVNQLTTEKKDLLTVKMYVVAGDPGNVRPTQQLADDYRNKLGLSFAASPDLPWQWNTFKALYKKFHGVTDVPSEELRVPAAFILDDKGVPFHMFKAGATTFVPAQVVGLATTYLN